MGKSYYLCLGKATKPQAPRNGSRSRSPVKPAANNNKSHRTRSRSRSRSRRESSPPPRYRPQKRRSRSRSPIRSAARKSRSRSRSPRKSRSRSRSRSHEGKHSTRRRSPSANFDLMDDEHNFAHIGRRDGLQRFRFDMRMLTVAPYNSPVKAKTAVLASLWQQGLFERYLHQAKPDERKFAVPTDAVSSADIRALLPDDARVVNDEDDRVISGRDFWSMVNELQKCKEWVPVERGYAETITYLELGSYTFATWADWC